MSTIEHLFESALYSIWNDKNFENWLEDVNEICNKCSVSPDVIEVLWTAANYVVGELGVEKPAKRFTPKKENPPMLPSGTCLTCHWRNRKLCYASMPPRYECKLSGGLVFLKDGCDNYERLKRDGYDEFWVD